MTLGALLNSARLMFHGGDSVQVLTADASMEECQAISALACWSAEALHMSTTSYKAAARALVLKSQELATADRAWTDAWWAFNVEIETASLNGIFANGKLAQFGGRFLYDSDPYCKDFGNQSCMVTAQTGRSWFLTEGLWFLIASPPPASQPVSKIPQETGSISSADFLEAGL